ncbi:capsid protein [Pacific flying fox faeces associated gemycircularvirus-7]|uniref:Capsid protein n=1 Tax=Pacific flying fox faeces associated gemycircularvirus-7 TaxID=1795999 RepID=A0A140CTN2_9VIRU|nr:capsid protein [Pacific flying fox faeces associated gemycircularvirus-7]AMH87689.1 capsid protein [Pacific flying fox faeces associated gemycircularvirus-7]
MPYGRYRRSSYRRYGRSRYAPRSYVRRPYYGVRRPFYSRRRYRPVSRSILNVSSVKKKDNMLAVTNVLGTARPSVQPFQDGAASLVGSTAGRGSPYVFIWNATARDHEDDSTKYDEAARTSSAPYMVGLKERILVQTSDANPWQWRRICFTAKGLNSSFLTAGAGANENNPFYEDSTGFRREVAEPGSAGLTNIRNIIFDGAYGIDWNDPFSAKTDNQRIKVRYDKTRMIRSTNNVGVIRYYNMWHPMKKTLMYNDDENGASMDSAYVAQMGDMGMGDYFVLDFIRCIDAPSGTPGLIFQPEATLYWHER